MTFSFKYNDVDSITLDSFLKKIYKDNPILCDKDKDFTDFKMAYNTVFTDSCSGQQMYSNINFYKDEFVVSYGKCDNIPDLQEWVNDTLSCCLPSTQLLSVERHQDDGIGCCETAIYHFRRPVEKKALSELMSACKQKEGWKFRKEDKNFCAEYGDTYYMALYYKITLIEDDQKEINYAKIEIRNN